MPLDIGIGNSIAPIEVLSRQHSNRITILSFRLPFRASNKRVLSQLSTLCTVFDRLCTKIWSLYRNLKSHVLAMRNGMPGIDMRVALGKAGYIGQMHAY
jgi:hypothetical protein